MAYSPDRGALGVKTNANVEIQFDRPVDKASVAARFSLVPATTGRVTWPTARRLVYVHAPLRTDTEYQVLLRTGYRSLAGGTNDLDHTWSFRTEGPLEVIGWSPGTGERGVDPAAYLTVSFNHPVTNSGLAHAFSLDPAMPIDVHVDPTDSTRAVIAPRGLLQPDQAYTLRALTTLHDAHGNPLPKPLGSTFETGDIRPLHGWLSYLQAPASSPARTPGSLWMVDATRVPRQLVQGPVLAYNWSPDADELALEVGPRTWADLRLGAGQTPLGVAADWVQPLGSERGFALVDGGTLALLTAAGERFTLATGVDQVAVSRDGGELAYTVIAGDSTEIWAVNVDLRSRYLVQMEQGSVLGLAWAPDAQRLAYELIAQGASSIRVRSLSQAAAATVATGQVSDPAWDADSQHLFVLALGGTPVQERVYRVAVASQPQAVGGGGGMPAESSLDAGPPAASADGRQLAFVASLGAGRQIWLMNADGTGLVRLTDPAYSCSEPSWTPA